MAGQCKECRFYDGKLCAVTKAARTYNFTCSAWASNTSSSSSKQCKDCKFYDGKNCSAGSGQRTYNSTCAKWAAYR